MLGTRQKKAIKFPFWDPEIPVGSDLSCSRKTLFVAIFFLCEKILCSGVVCLFTTPELLSARSWWGRMVPDGQLILESEDQAESRSWPGRACEPRDQRADLTKRVLFHDIGRPTRRDAGSF